MSDQHFVVITLTLQLFELFLEGSVVVVQILVHLFVFVQLGFVLADCVLQLDFALVGLVAVVFEFVLDIADLGLLVGEFVLEVLLGLEQVVVVVLESLHGGVHVVDGELVLLLQVVQVGLERLFVRGQVHEVVVERLVVADQHLGLLAQALALVLEPVDLAAQVVAGLVLAVVQVRVVVLGLAQALLGLAQLDGGAVLLLLQLRLALVVVVEFLGHAVLQFGIAAVVLPKAVLQCRDFVVGLLEFGFGLVGFGPEGVDFGVFLGQDLALVPLELVEVTQDEFVISLCLLVVLSDRVQAFDTFLIFVLQFGQIVFQVIELALEFGSLLLPGEFLFLLPLLDVVEFLLEVLVGVGLVPEAVLETLGLLVHLVELLVVLVLHLVGLVAE